MSFGMGLAASEWLVSERSIAIFSKSHKSHSLSYMALSHGFPYVTFLQGIMQNSDCIGFGSDPNFSKRKS